MQRTVVFLVMLCAGVVSGPSRTSAHRSVFCDQPRIVHRASGLQIRYTQRKLPGTPKKTLVWTADDADWLRRTFDCEKSFSVLQLSTVPAVGYIKDVFVDRKSTSLLLVFRGEGEQVGVTIQFPSEKDEERAQQEDEQALTIVTIYGSWQFAPAYLVEFFKTASTKPTRSSLLARCIKGLLVVAGVWWAIKTAQKYVLQKLRVDDCAQKAASLNESLGVAACGIAAQEMHKKMPELAIVRDAVVVAVVPNVSDRVAHLEVERAVTVAHIEQEVPFATPGPVPGARMPDCSARGARRTPPVGGAAGVKIPQSPAPEEIFTGLSSAQREAFDVCGCSKAIRLYVQRKRDWLAVLVSRGVAGSEKENAQFLQKLLVHVECSGVDQKKIKGFYKASDGLQSDGVVYLVNKQSEAAYCVQFGRLMQDYIASGIRGIRRVFSRDYVSNVAHVTRTAGDLAAKVTDLGASSCDMLGICEGIWVDWLCYGDAVMLDSGEFIGMHLVSRGITHFHEIKGQRGLCIVLGSAGLWRAIKYEELSERVCTASSTGEPVAEYLCSVATAGLFRETCADYTRSNGQSGFSASTSIPSALVIDIPKLIAAIA